MGDPDEEREEVLVIPVTRLLRLLREELAPRRALVFPSVTLAVGLGGKSARSSACTRTPSTGWRDHPYTVKAKDGTKTRKVREGTKTRAGIERRVRFQDLRHT